eukprot:m.224573 g.224573  ORF g.224573 m.224573 type:complete len:311 (+) comp11111_c0_seq1:24-956(+)
MSVFRILARRSFATAASKRLPPAEWKALTQSVTNLSVPAAVHELTKGAGFVLFDNIFTPAEIDEANHILDAICEPQAVKASSKENYTFGKDTGHSNIYGVAAAQGIRVWNLLEKGAIFERIVQAEPTMEIVARVIGDDFCLGSIAANYLQPGAGAQKPHLDYPYWDYVNGKGTGVGAWPSIPKNGPEHTFFMNFQTLVMLDDFTEENGATAVIPYSQRNMAWPDDAAFERDHNLVTGKRGTVLCFTGLVQHGSTENRTNKKRCSILSQYLPKFVRPMEDMNQVGDAVRKRATPRMKQLLGEHTPYPKVFE